MTFTAAPGTQPAHVACRASRTHVLTNSCISFACDFPAGFDGQLTAKMNVLRSCPAFIRSLSTKSDLRGLAYVATAETFSWGSRVYAAGQPCQKGAVYIIQEGSCRVSVSFGGWRAGGCVCVSVLPQRILGAGGHSLTLWTLPGGVS